MHDELQAHNRRATIVLLVAGFTLMVLLSAAGGVILTGGQLTPESTVLIGGGSLLFAGVTSAIGWWTSDKVAIKASGAIPADPVHFADLHRLVDGLCLASGLPKPRVYVIDDMAPNAFATGRNPENAAIAVTRGLLERMDRRELEAVLAHELGHIRNNDLLAATLAVTLAGAAMLVGDLVRRKLFWGGTGGRRGRSNSNGSSQGPFVIVLLVISVIAIILVPVAVQLIRFAVSRQREYLADATAVELTRDPQAMIDALRQLDADPTEIRTASRATAHLWIEEPMNLDRRANRAVATHPPISERIARLESLYGQTPA